MVHQFHKGRQGEGQHVSKAAEQREAQSQGPNLNTRKDAEFSKTIGTNSWIQMTSHTQEMRKGRCLK
jgi:hypothetical protein